MDFHLRGIVLDHFKLRMVHAKALAAQLRLPENDQLLAGRDHFLHVMQIEPAQGERLTQRVRVWFPKCRLKNLFPAAEAKYSRFGYLSAQTDGSVALFARNFWKLMSGFGAPGKGGEKTLTHS